MCIRYVEVGDVGLLVCILRGVDVLWMRQYGLDVLFLNMQQIALLNVGI